MASNVDRRHFLELSLAAGGVALVNPFELAARVGAPTEAGTDRWVPTCCQMCGGQTGVQAHVVDGVVVKIEPNPHNPVGLTNVSDDFFSNQQEQPVMCPKGNAAILTLYDPDRVRRPLRRANPEKGKGIDPKWKEISWDEALGEIAARMKTLRDAGEAQKVLWFTEDSSWIPVQQDFCDLYGTPNFYMHSSLCDVGRKASMKLVCGNDRPLIDAIHSKYMLIFGWNPLSATKWAHLPRIITRARENGAKLVVVDPYLSYTASKADEWVPIRPGTDGAFALALAHVIIRDKLYDKKFVEDWTVGSDEFAAYVKDKSPAWAEPITGISAKTTERIAHEFATTAPQLVDVWSGTHHTNGVQAGRAIGLLAALVGGYDRPGTLIIPERKGPPRLAPTAAKITQPRYDGYPDRVPFGHVSGDYTEVVQRLLKGTGPYQPKMAMIFFQNLALSVPGTKNVLDALKNLDFIVAVDTLVSETAEMADIVLPGTTFLERYELSVPWVSWTVIALRQPVVQPIFGQMAEYDVILDLGRRLGLKDSDGKEFFTGLTYEDYLSRMLQKSPAKVTLEQLRALPGAVWVDEKGTAYEKFKRELPAEKTKDAIVIGDQVYDKAPDNGGKVIGLFKDNKYVQGFPTHSGKIEFYSEWLKSKKDGNGQPVNPLPVYVQREWQPTKEYPLQLINWKEASHTHTRTMNNPWLMELKGNNPLVINRKTAERLTIKDGDAIWVESPYGKDQAVAKVTEGIHPDVVGWQHGFGHWAMGRVAKGKGTNGGQFVPTKSDALSGQALHKECCVRVYRLQG
jgi:thiosulfate reductase/polysulfide reductase chain A